MDNRRRELLHRLAAAGLLGPAGISGLVSQALAADRLAPGIRQQKGAVLINDRPARPGQVVRPGDTVITAPDAEVAYVIGRNAFLQRGGATIAFGRSAEHFMRVVTGRILSVFGTGRQRNLRVSTATIGIRGTGCYIEDEGEGASARTYFCLCYGSADLVPRSAPQERELIKTEHHDHPLYIHNDMGMPKMMVPAKVINHTDAELTLLESLVGRQPPFAGKEYSY